MTRRGLRLASVLLAGVAYAAMAAQPGVAGTASVASGTLSYSGAMSVTIDFVVPMPLHAYYQVVDTGGATAGAGCSQTSVTEVRCGTGVFGTDVSAISVTGTSGGDTITLTEDVTVPATILGMAGGDTLTGGSGNDFVSDEATGGCNSASDTVNGGEGNDTLRGCLGSDTLNGGAGADDLADSGSGLTDTFNGGTGDDTINSRDGDADAVNCGPGEDRLRENATDSRAECDLFFPRNTAQPTISGTAREGETLTASPGTWTGTVPISFAYQWRRCTFDGTLMECIDIAGATGASYAVDADDVDTFLRVEVTATNLGGSDPASVDTDDVTASTPRNTAPPLISGTPHVGESLPTSNGVWAMTKEPITGFTYQWRRCLADGSGCTDIVGATAQAYNVAAADMGASLRSVVTATNSLGSTAASSAHVVVSAPFIAAPGNCTIEGTDGNDVINGTRGNDVICAGKGNDIVYGRGGNDVILLGPGNDRGFGGAGKDRIVGGKGKDRLFGGGGNDTLLAKDRVKKELVDGGAGRRDRCTTDRGDVKRRCP